MPSKASLIKHDKEGTFDKYLSLCKEYYDIIPLAAAHIEDARKG